MGIRNGKQFLAMLGDTREVWLDGKRVESVATDPRLCGAARTIAGLYDMQHDPKWQDVLTYVSPGTGERVGMSFIEPKTQADLERRRLMVYTWMTATCGMFGRSADFMNIQLAAFAAAAPEFAKQGAEFGERIRAYYERVRDNDWVLTHTLLNPQVDRSKPVQDQEKDLAAKIIGENAQGIIVRGARMVSTLAAYSDELLVMPSTYIEDKPEAAPYAFAFAVPVAAKGLKVICRPSVLHMGAASKMDWPLSHRLDETDAMIVFDDVLIPWDRVFVYKSASMCNGLYNRTLAMNQIMHQFCTKNLAKAEFMLGVATAIAQSTKSDVHLHVQGMLAEMIQSVEMIRACLRASEADCKPTPFGTVAPAEMPLWTVRMMFPKMYVRMREIIQTLGAGGLVSVPSYADLEGGAGAIVEQYFQGATIDARQRVKLFRLAFDVGVSSFSGRQELYERYYSGDPVRLASALYGMYPKKEEYMQRVWSMLDKLEHGDEADALVPAVLA